MNITKLIDDVKAPRLDAECSECEEDFPLSTGVLFDGLGDFPKSQATCFLPYLDYMYPYAS